MTFGPLQHNLCCHSGFLGHFGFDTRKVKFPVIFAGSVFLNVSLLSHRLAFRLATARLACCSFLKEPVTKISVYCSKTRCPRRGVRTVRDKKEAAVPGQERGAGTSAIYGVCLLFVSPEARRTQQCPERCVPGG